MREALSAIAGEHKGDGGTAPPRGEVEHHQQEKVKDAKPYIGIGLSRSSYEKLCYTPFKLPAFAYGMRKRGRRLGDPENRI